LRYGAGAGQQLINCFVDRGGFSANGEEENASVAKASSMTTTDEK